jgi:septal ring factor EnvC (AmiA/AmiB activator)
LTEKTEKNKEPLPIAWADYATQYYLTLDRAEDKKLQDNWQEQIVKERERKRPTTREEVMKQIQKEGRYTISTLSEAIRIIELIREDYFRQLEAMKTAQAEIAAANETIKAKEEKIRALKRQLEDLEQNHKYLEWSLKEVQTSKKNLEEENTQLKKSNNNLIETLQTIKWNLSRIVGESREVANKIKPGGLFGGKAAAEKLGKVLEDILEAIEALNKKLRW